MHTLCHKTTRALATLLGVGLVVAAGCGERRQSQRQEPGDRAAMSFGDTSGVLLEGIASQLATLPEQSIVELKPEEPILDARRSTNNQDILAVTERAPNTPPGFDIYNRLVVPAGNADFRNNDIRTGDIVKYYAKVDSELGGEYRSKSGGFTAADRDAILKLSPEEQENLFEAELNERIAEGDIQTIGEVKLRVAQVVDANTIIVDQPLNQLRIDGSLAADAYEGGKGARLEIWRVADRRTGELIIGLNRYATQGVPQLGWEPSPDREALQQIVERLNQWLMQVKQESEWSEPKVLATLPDELREEPALQPFVSSEALKRTSFSLTTEEERAMQDVSYEGRLLQEATWARDIGHWVTAGSRREDRPAKLFDWTIRSLQLDDLTDEAKAIAPTYRPWQAMLYGHATAEGRAWIFAQLCRHRGLTPVIIQPATEQDETPAWFWCGVVDRNRDNKNGEDQIYLFDPKFGLPLRTPDGDVATLSGVREHSEWLAELGTKDNPYRAADADLSKLDAFVVAGPFAMTERAARLQAALRGESALRLAADVDKQADAIKASGGFDQVRLWPFPFQQLLAQLNQNTRQRSLAALEFEPFCYRPHLWRARMLHFRGLKKGEQVVASDSSDHEKAGLYYNSPRVRPANREIAKQESRDVQRAWLRAKANATYWNALLRYDQNNPKVARQWFERAAQVPAWRRGALTNSARSLDKLGEAEKAIELLESDEPALPPGSKPWARRIKKFSETE